MRRSIALVLSLVMASCVSLNVMAIEADTPEKVSLKTVFEEAAAKVQPHTRMGEAEPQYYEEYTTELEPASGYTFSSMAIQYFSHTLIGTKESVDKTITVT